MPTFFDENPEPFTSAHALTHDIDRAALHRMLKQGRIRHVLSDVYVSAVAPDSPRLRARAAALVMPDHAVVCDRSAAWMHGIDILDFAELDVPPALEMVSTKGHNRSIRAGVFGGERDLLGSEIMLIDGVKVTTPLRTACDIACLRGRRRALATLDAFRRQFRISVQDLVDMLPRYARRRGVVQLRELIPLSTDIADSQPESWTRMAIHDFGLPMPQAQVWVELPGWGPARLENAYEHLRIAVEYDGAEFHTRAEDVEHDDERRRILREVLGWHIIVLRKNSFTAAAVDVWLRELRRVIAERTPYQPTKRIYSRGPDELSAYRRRARY